MLTPSLQTHWLEEKNIFFFCRFQKPILIEVTYQNVCKRKNCLRIYNILPIHIYIFYSKGTKINILHNVILQNIYGTGLLSLSYTIGVVAGLILKERANLWMVKNHSVVKSHSSVL